MCAYVHMHLNEIVKYNSGRLSSCDKIIIFSDSSKDIYHDYIHKDPFIFVNINNINDFELEKSYDNINIESIFLLLKNSNSKNEINNFLIYSLESLNFLKYKFNNIADNKITFIFNNIKSLFFVINKNAESFDISLLFNIFEYYKIKKFFCLRNDDDTFNFFCKNLITLKKNSKKLKKKEKLNKKDIINIKKKKQNFEIVYEFLNCLKIYNNNNNNILLYQINGLIDLGNLYYECALYKRGKCNCNSEIQHKENLIKLQMDIINFISKKQSKNISIILKGLTFKNPNKFRLISNIIKNIKNGYLDFNKLKNNNFIKNFNFIICGLDNISNFKNYDYLFKKINPQISCCCCCYFYNYDDNNNNNNSSNEKIKLCNNKNKNIWYFIYFLTFLLNNKIQTYIISIDIDMFLYTDCIYCKKIFYDVIIKYISNQNKIINLSINIKNDFNFYLNTNNVIDFLFNIYVENISLKGFLFNDESINKIVILIKSSYIISLMCEGLCYFYPSSLPILQSNILNKNITNKNEEIFKALNIPIEKRLISIKQIKNSENFYDADFIYNKNNDVNNSEITFKSNTIVYSNEEMNDNNNIIIKNIDDDDDDNNNNILKNIEKINSDNIIIKNSYQINNDDIIIKNIDEVHGDKSIIKNSFKINNINTIIKNINKISCDNIIIKNSDQNNNDNNIIKNNNNNEINGDNTIIKNIDQNNNNNIIKNNCKNNYNIILNNNIIKNDDKLNDNNYNKIDDYIDLNIFNMNNVDIINDDLNIYEIKDNNNNNNNNNALINQDLSYLNDNFINHNNFLFIDEDFLRKKNHYDNDDLNIFLKKKKRKII